VVFEIQFSLHEALRSLLKALEVREMTAVDAFLQSCQTFCVKEFSLFITRLSLLFKGCIFPDLKCLVFWKSSFHKIHTCLQFCTSVIVIL